MSSTHSRLASTSSSSSSPPACRHIFHTQNSFAECIDPNSVLGRSKELKLVSRLLHRAIEDGIDFGIFLCVATVKGEAKAAYESGCVGCYIDAVEHSGLERLKSVRSGMGSEERMAWEVEVALSRLGAWAKHIDVTMIVRVVANNKEVVTFIENLAKHRGFDDNNPQRPCQHFSLDRGIPNDYVVPSSLVDRRKNVAMVKRLLRLEIEDGIDQGTFLCIATHQAALMVAYQTGCEECHLKMAGKADFKLVSLIASRSHSISRASLRTCTNVIFSEG